MNFVARSNDVAILYALTTRRSALTLTATISHRNLLHASLFIACTVYNRI